jgi:hypothetical protein
MSVISALTPPSARRVSWRRWLLILLVLPPLAVVAASWWLTEPLASTPAARATPAPPPAPSPTVPSAPILAAAEWPSSRLEGDAAKRLLLEILVASERRLVAIPSYTATLRKRERIHGVLGPEQTLAIKVRHRPWAIYLKFLAPKAGKEVVYVEGKHDNKLIAHAGDWTRRLVPRIAVAPTDPLALAENRHPVTEAGLLHLTRRLLEFRRLDLGDSEAVTVMDRMTDDTGRPWLRSVHLHPHPDETRPFARVEVLYDPETMIPRRTTNYEWPKTGPSAEPEFAEMYAYDDLDLDATLSDLDFDPANPAYAFTRY